MQEHGYLSNMAVAHKYRRRGYGRLLLEAAEQTCNLSGHRDLFLHLRYSSAMTAPLLLHLAHRSCLCLISSICFSEIQQMASCYFDMLIASSQPYMLSRDAC